MGRADGIYARLPVAAQNAAVSFYGVYWNWLRFGPGYRRYVDEFTRRERLDAGAWNTWQEQAVRRVLATATEVPYYDQTWSRAEKEAARAGRLRDLPLLEKDAVRDDPWRLVRPGVPGRHYVHHTSGTTGTPIASIWTAAEIRKSKAVREVRSARWAGTSFSRPRATFSGRMAVPDPDSRGPYHRFNWIERQVYFSPFHLRPDTAPAYVEALRRHGIEWLTGYAVSYYLLARFILEQGLEVPPLRAVITTSEKLLPHMREHMSRAFRCPVFEEYSTVENALFVSECEEGRLHVSPDVGIVEILRDDGSPCDPGEPGEVVTTTTMRSLQPLIRYRLGDRAVWSAESCGCGRSMPVIEEVLGRIEDVVIGPDGRRLVRFHGLFIDQPHIREGQVIQEAVDRLRIRVVPVPGFDRADIEDLKRRVHARLGSGMEVQVEAVDEIPRTRSGKFPAVISLLHDRGVAEAERTGVAALE